MGWQSVIHIKARLMNMADVDNSIRNQVGEIMKLQGYKR
jgi:hypothetical protein